MTTEIFYETNETRVFNNRSITKFLPVQSSRREQWGGRVIRARRLLTIRDFATGSKVRWRAVNNYFPNTTAGMQFKPRRIMRTMSHRELVDKSEGGLERLGDCCAVATSDTYRRSIGRTVLLCTRSSHCPSSDFQCCCRCRRCCGISTSHHILRYAPRHKIHQAGCPAAPASICSERSHFCLSRICDQRARSKLIEFPFLSKGRKWEAWFEKQYLKIALM